MDLEKIYDPLLNKMQEISSKLTILLKTSLLEQLEILIMNKLVNNNKNFQWITNEILKCNYIYVLKIIINVSNSTKDPANSE